jgi:hypothetical protein
MSSRKARLFSNHEHKNFTEVSQRGDTTSGRVFVEEPSSEDRKEMFTVSRPNELIATRFSVFCFLFSVFSQVQLFFVKGYVKK